MRVLITLMTKHDAVSPPCYHERANVLERHRSVHCYEARNRAHPEGDAAGQRLPRARAALHELLERRVCRKANGRISALPHHLRIGLANMHARGPRTRNEATRHTTGKSPR